MPDFSDHQTSDAAVGLTVTLRVKDGQTPTFLDAMAANQRGALAEEPGCLAFLVGRDLDEANVFNLFEVYRDHTALAVHRASAHFQQWRRVAAQVLEPGGTESRLSQLVLCMEPTDSSGFHR